MECTALLVYSFESGFLNTYQYAVNTVHTFHVVVSFTYILIPVLRYANIMYCVTGSPPLGDDDIGRVTARYKMHYLLINIIHCFMYFTLYTRN